MRVIKGQAVLKKSGDTKWPHAPLPAHPIMSRGELAKRHAADVAEKAFAKQQQPQEKKPEPVVEKKKHGRKWFRPEVK